MKIIKPTSLHGTVRPPTSKSISHRALLLAALGRAGSEIRHILESRDVNATKECLERMGAEFEPIEDGYRLVKGIYQGSSLLNCYNSGTTLRLLTAVSALYPEHTTLFGDESLNARPMQPLLDALELLGAETISDNGTAPIEISSPIKNYQTVTQIRGDESSQYISALLIMAVARGDNLMTKIKLLPPVVSKPYIDLTVEMLRAQQIEIISEAAGYIVQGATNLGHVSIDVPTDFSSAAFMIVAGVLNGNAITITNISSAYPQADSRIIEFCKSAGANITVDGSNIMVEGGKLLGFDADLSDSPDLFPILAVLATCCAGTTRLHNAKHLRIKETDRIRAMVTNLEQVGIEVEELPDGAIITGGRIKGDVVLETYHDHRIAMALAILGTKAESPITIRNHDCVDVSYPQFYQQLEELSQDVS